MRANRINYIKEDIRRSVSIRQVVEHYTGIKLDKNGFCKCPLHNEKTASFKVDDGKGLYYCFGCGAGGDVFKFVQVYFGINFNDAVSKIDSDFMLGLIGQKISVKAQIAMREAKRSRELESIKEGQKNKLYDDLCEQYRAINSLLNELKPLTDEWGEAISKKAWLEHELDKML